MKTWRLITSGSMSAAGNMALDDALLQAFDPESSLPVLRLYGWDPPGLSLGRFQQAGDVLNLEYCRSAGVAVVRRITGGGVIYHADELTYSIVCTPQQMPASSSIKESFRVLTAFLLAFYRGFGLDAGYAVDCAADSTRLGERTPFCFAGRESYDILVAGRKIGGNAQRRLKKVIFQHGSIPLLNRVATGLGFLRERPAGLEGQTCSLADVGVEIDLVRLTERLAAAFTGSFNVALQPDRPSQRELSLAEQLGRARYLNSVWNLKGEEA